MYATRSRARLAHPPNAAGALLVAGLCVAALALTWVVAALVPATHVKDAVALHDFTLLGGPRADDLANALLHLLEPALYILWAILLMAVALRRGRPRVALAVAVVMGMAPATAELLKPLLAHPHAPIYGDEISAASWPSGHASAATALAMSAVLVAPHGLGAGRNLRGGRRLLAGPARLASAERCRRRLPGRHALDGAGRRGPAQG
jgi:membrane-associated phospholipid phosphatase